MCDRSRPNAASSSARCGSGCFAPPMPLRAMASGPVWSAHSDWCAAAALLRPFPEGAEPRRQLLVVAAVAEPAPGEPPLADPEEDDVGPRPNAALIAIAPAAFYVRRGREDP